MKNKRFLRMKANIIQNFKEEIKNKNEVQMKECEVELCKLKEVLSDIQEEMYLNLDNLINIWNFSQQILTIIGGNDNKG